LTHDGGHQCINMVRSEVSVATRTHDYGSSQHVVVPDPPPIEIPLQIDNIEPPPRIPKGVLKSYAHNPNSRAPQNYSIVEDLGQTPCVMLDLEVLYMCATQRNSLLFALVDLYASGSKVIKFNVVDVKRHFPYHVGGMNITIKHIVIDEVDLTSIMYLSYWKSIGSPSFSQSMTMLTTFNGHSFRPHGILPTFSVQLESKTLEVEVEMVEAPLD
jgi:hypothetical protein